MTDDTRLDTVRRDRRDCGSGHFSACGWAEERILAYHNNGGPAVPKFTDPGKWYFVVDCLDCECPIPLADAPSPAEKPDPLRYRKISDVKCPHCGGLGTYTPCQISRRQVEHTPGDRFQATILYVFAGIAALSFLAAVLFVSHTYR